MDGQMDRQMDRQMVVLPDMYLWMCVYSGANWTVYKYCFMKQKCKLQTGITQYKNVATPLKTKGINTTHQDF